MDDAGGQHPTVVLREAWGINAPIGPQHHGISRATWQAGTIGWLARESAARASETVAELRLLSTLATTAPFAVPIPIPTLHGSNIAQTDGYTWTLCRHIPGERLADAPASYRHLITILATVHRTLRDYGQQHAVLHESLLGRAAEYLHAAPRDLMPAAREASAWLQGRIGALNSLRPQLIHGDFGVHNVLVSADDPQQFGILDWELSSFDSPIFDLAQIAFGIIAFSSSQAPSDLLPMLTRWYAKAGGQRFSAEQLATALVAGRLGQIRWLQGRVAQGEEALVESVRFLDERLTRVLRWLALRL